MSDNRCSDRWGGIRCQKLAGHLDDHQNLLMRATWDHGNSVAPATGPQVADVGSWDANGSDPAGFAGWPNATPISEASPVATTRAIDPDNPEAHRIARAALNEVIIPPYDPDPPRKAPAIDGFRICHGCDKAISAVASVPHECPGSDPFDRAKMEATWDSAMQHLRDRGEDPEALVLIATANLARWESEARAEFAESVLCAMAWDHGTCFPPWLIEQRTGRVAEPGLCQPHDNCIFCDAARIPEARATR